MSKKISAEHRSFVRSWWGILGSWGGIGLIPIAPGTFASVATLPLGWGIATLAGSWSLVAASLLVFAAGVVVAAHIVRHTQVEDASVIVIDEVAGQLLALAAAPLNWQAYLVGFIAFRLFDVTKPWPASWADRELSGGVGVMVDDMAAGFYALLVVVAFHEFGWI